MTAYLPKNIAKTLAAKTLASGAAALLLIGYALPGDIGHAQSSTAQSVTNWTKRVSETQMGGHLLGNPLAKTKLVEYMSYTCPHCAAFDKDGKGPLTQFFISKGDTSFELRNAVRDPVDMTVALLARCGTKDAFFTNHTALLKSQPVWLGKASAASEAVTSKWYVGDFNTRLQTIATDLGLDAEMAKLKYSKAQVNACLSSKKAQDAVLAMTQYGNQTVKIEGTPSFTLNGALLDKVHDWKALEQRLINR